MSDTQTGVGHSHAHFSEGIIKGARNRAEPVAIVNIVIIDVGTRIIPCYPRIVVIVLLGEPLSHYFTPTPIMFSSFLGYVFLIEQMPCFAILDYVLSSWHLFQTYRPHNKSTQMACVFLLSKPFRYYDP